MANRTQIIRIMNCRSRGDFVFPISALKAKKTLTSNDAKAARIPADEEKTGLSNPLKSATMEAVAAVPFATAETVFANPKGAAWTQFAEITVVNTAAGRATPRFVKNNRNFSTARLMRLRVA